MPYTLDEHRNCCGNNCCANPLYHVCFWTICCCICLAIAVGTLSIFNHEYADWEDATGTVVGVVEKQDTREDSRGQWTTVIVYCAELNFLTEDGQNITAVGEDFCQDSSSEWREGRKYEILYDPVDPEGGIMLTEVIEVAKTALTGYAVFTGIVFAVCLCLSFFFLRKRMFENNQDNQNNPNLNNPNETISPFQRPNTANAQPTAIAEPVIVQPQTQQTYSGGGFASALGSPPASAPPPPSNPWIK